MSVLKKCLFAVAVILIAIVLVLFVQTSYTAIMQDRNSIHHHFLSESKNAQYDSQPALMMNDQLYIFGGYYEVGFDPDSHVYAGEVKYYTDGGAVSKNFECNQFPVGSLIYKLNYDAYAVLCDGEAAVFLTNSFKALFGDS